MIKRDVESLLKWRHSLEREREEIERAIAECDRQIRYFDGVQGELPNLETESKRAASEIQVEKLREAVMLTLHKYRGKALTKEEIVTLLGEETGFPIEHPGFAARFNGFIGSLVRNKHIKKTTNGEFVYEDS